MEPEDVDLDELLDDALDDFEREEAKAEAEPPQRTVATQPPSSSNAQIDDLDAKDPSKLLAEAFESDAFKEELKKTFEAATRSGELPPDANVDADAALEEFKNALMSSFANLAKAAEENGDGGGVGGGMPVPPPVDLEGGGGGAEAMEAFLKDVLSKDVLYDPMRELRDRYPSWLEKNKGKVSESDFERYSKQRVLVEKVCIAYESDASFDEIAMLMEQISQLGQAPQEMLMEIAPQQQQQDGQQKPPLPDNCNVM